MAEKSYEKPNSVAFDSEKNPNYKQDIINLIDILTRNEYVCDVRYEDCGIYVVRFGDTHANEWGGAELVWIDNNKQAIIDLKEDGTYDLD